MMHTRSSLFPAEISTSLGSFARRAVDLQLATSTSHRHETCACYLHGVSAAAAWIPVSFTRSMLSSTPTSLAERADSHVLIVLDPQQPAASAPVLVTHARLFRATDPVTCTVALTIDDTPDVQRDVLEFLEVLLDGHAIPARLSITSVAAIPDIEWAAAFAPQGDKLEDARAQSYAIAALHGLRTSLDAVPAVAASGSSQNSSQLCGTYIGNNRILVRTCWNLPLIVPADDLSLTPLLLLHGFFELSLQRFILRTLTNGDHVMDLGANVGAHTVLMAMAVGANGRVVAYEAVPEIAGFLRDNITMNCLAAQTTIVEKAAWSGDATLQFTTTAKYRGNGSLRAKDAGYLERYGADEFSSIQVSAESPAVHDTGATFALIKIDVEGAEPQVLDGLDTMIRAGRVRILVLEYLHWVLGEEAEARLVALLSTYQQELGATFARLDDAGQEHSLQMAEILQHRHFPDLVIRFPAR